MIKEYLPENWKEKDVIKDEGDKMSCIKIISILNSDKLGKWDEWLKVVRPLMGAVAAVIYCVQILVFIVL